MTAKRRGRPVEGVPVQVRIPADLLARVDETARRRGVSRAAVVRAALVRELLEAAMR